jgi:glycosyltransferase involved in cell wall biosynthesis
MRILFLSNLYPPNVVGGYERLCFEAASALSARGHEISVLTSDYGGRTAEYAGQRVARCWKLPVGREAIYQPFQGTPEEREAIAAHNVQCLQEQIALATPGLLFAWNLFFLDTTLLQAIERQGLPTVFLLTDNWLIAFLNNPFWQRYLATDVLSDGRSWLHQLRLRFPPAFFGVRKFDLGARAIFASRYMEELYRRAGLRFADSTVIHHGIIDADVALPERRDRLRAPGELRLLVAGRLVEIKGVHTAIDALPRVIRGLPQLRVVLTVVGDRADAAYFERLQGRVQTLGIADHVTFEPAVRETELPQLFARHDVYVFPSLYEPFSLTLIHALRAGIPTIASDAGGNVEIVRDGNTGRVFHRGNARALADIVIELARDSTQRVALAQAGRRIAAEHSFTRMLDQIEQYLAAAL